VARQRTPLELVVALDRLLDQLQCESHQMCSVVELKFFLGLTDAEAADVLHMSLRSTERAWHDARRWLFQRLSKDDWQSLSRTMTA
jgi:DNA-directed RNA polymerase specialized sigma24 family protein